MALFTAFKNPECRNHREQPLDPPKISNAEIPESKRRDFVRLGFINQNTHTHTKVNTTKMSGEALVSKKVDALLPLHLRLLFTPSFLMPAAKI